jgi:hypothetical protein
MEEQKPLTVPEFARLKGVPIAAITAAIRANRIIPMEVSGELYDCTIHPAYLETFKIDLIGVYDYAARKNVSYRAVYNRIDKGSIEYVLDEENKMKIDWERYHDVRFKAVHFKHRGNKTVVN